jgi:DNA processing protein
MQNIEDWIRLAKLESPKKAVALVDHFGSPEDALHASTEDLVSVDGITSKTAERIHNLASEPVEKELRVLEKLGAKVITYKDPDYPINLRQICDPPVVLFVRGEILEEDRFAIAVVGTRRPSEYGRAVATEISRDLAKRGLTIISGGARGIDTAAHTAALQTGRTIAVLGSGLDIPYPYENRGLLSRIAESGAVISEFVPGTKPDAWRFPVRNRLVSGLALGVLVVESRLSGGAMITATLAAEQGRDVWAVPGSTDNSASHGPHLLIKEGAKLVEKAEDILADLGIEVGEPSVSRKSIPSNLTAEQKAVLEALTLHPRHIDEITQECKLTPAVANSTLTLLEMLGLVRRVPGNCYVRAV